MNTHTIARAIMEVVATVDTSAIKQKYQPSTDINNPTAIPSDTQFLIASCPHGIISGQGTGYLVLNALIGDQMNIRGTSIEANSDDAVIVYGARHFSGSQIFGGHPWTTRFVTRSGVVEPDPTYSVSGGLPPLHFQKTFSRCTNTVQTFGIEIFLLMFGIYVLKNGQTQELYGYYMSELKIVIPNLLQNN